MHSVLVAAVHDTAAAVTSSACVVVVVDFQFALV
jgi:hypothetical protein